MKIFPLSALIQPVIRALLEAGATPYAVGGSVRDHLLGNAPSDFDIEVFGLEFSVLKSLLERFGSVHEVGQSFGIFKLSREGEVFDFSLPRRENKIGKGHQAFNVTPDPQMSFQEAAMRRDFTINAMGVNLKTNALEDFFGGQSDLKNKVLRHVSDHFDEDPLRVFRAAQFAARFELNIDKETLQKCKNLRVELQTLPKERICEEFKKMLLGKKPSLGLWILKNCDALSLFPELDALEDCPQDPQWHPEGNVFIHTAMVTDEAARIVRREKLDDETSLIVVLASLCHDLGKPATLSFEGARVRAKGHESAGEAPTRSLLAQLGFSQKVSDAVVPLVREHLKPGQLYRDRDKISESAIRRLSTRAHIPTLVLVAEADFLGRTTEEALLGVDPSKTWLTERAAELQVLDGAPKPLLSGKLLITHGVKPGVSMGILLSDAYEAQLNGEFKTLDEAEAWLKGKL